MSAEQVSVATQKGGWLFNTSESSTDEDRRFPFYPTCFHASSWLVRVPCAACRSFIVALALFYTSTMKISAALALATLGGASAYSVNRSTLRSLGQKNVVQTSAPRNVGKSMTMEGASVTSCWTCCSCIIAVFLHNSVLTIHHRLRFPKGNCLVL